MFSPLSSYYNFKPRQLIFDLTRESDRGHHLFNIIFGTGTQTKTYALVMPEQFHRWSFNIPLHHQIIAFNGLKQSKLTHSNCVITMVISDQQEMSSTIASLEGEQQKRHVICMVSDFFYPRVGGVESHIFTLSLRLISLGHHVVVITHQYEDRIGVRYMTNGLKIYYLPLLTFYNGVTLPTMLASLPLIRQIFIRDKVEIVHGHSAFSTLAHEAMAIGRLMGLKAVFTDHSLFGFADSSAIITNKLLQISLAGCNHCICVSNVCKENTILRAGIDESKVSVIPNGIDTTLFKPDLSKWENKKATDRIIVVVMCRLVYRKGIDLLPEIIRRTCQNYANVDFLIGGDGPKRLILEEVREKHCLHERVTMLGILNQCEVRETLVKGDIFLNTSLTEAFCMAIVEAAACGLQVVSTDVGGIREVLDSTMIFLAEPNIDNIFAKLEEAIKKHKNWSKKDVENCHSFVRDHYSWDDVAKQTVGKVYNKVKNESPLTTGQLLQRYGKCGTFAGPLFVLLFTLCHLFLLFLDWYIPIQFVDRAPPYNC